MKVTKEVPITLSELEGATFMPPRNALQPGVFYYSEAYMTGCLLCPCGCGEPVNVPVGRMADQD
jgi:hypothetical protein